jgi:hypothetical protein
MNLSTPTGIFTSCIFIYMHMYIYVYIHICIYKYLHTYIGVYAYMCGNICIYISYLHTYHTYIHTICILHIYHTYTYIRTGLTNSKALVEIPTPHKTTKVKDAKTNPTKVLSICNWTLAGKLASTDWPKGVSSTLPFEFFLFLAFFFFWAAFYVYVHIHINIHIYIYLYIYIYIYVYIYVYIYINIHINICM